MKPLLFLTAFALPVAVMLSRVEAFAQGPNSNANPQSAQATNINYYQLINYDDNINQINFMSQQANPPQQGGGLGSLFGSNKTNNAPCTDCDKVKKAMKLSRSASAGGTQKRSFSMKKWSRTFSGKMNMKMRKVFARKHKIRTNYAICFNWH